MVRRHRALTATLGRPIHYEPASVLGYVRHLSRQGLPRGAIVVQTFLHFLLRFGQGATVDATMEWLGRPGRDVREYIADHAHLWTKPSEPPMKTTSVRWRDRGLDDACHDADGARDAREDHQARLTKHSAR